MAGIIYVLPLLAYHIINSYCWMCLPGYWFCSPFSVLHAMLQLDAFSESAGKQSIRKKAIYDHRRFICSASDVLMSIHITEIVILRIINQFTFESLV